MPITTHVAQSPEEVATIAARHDGRTPAEYLDWLGLLAPDLLAAHCIASTDDDLRLMAARGATVLNCPRVFARAGIVAAFGRFAAHGVRTVVGTDGYNMDLLGELNAASLISKVAAGRRRRRDVARADRRGDRQRRRRDRARRSRRDRARRHRGSHRGRLTPPAPAAARRSAPRADRAGNRANIDKVMVDGRMLVADGRYLAWRRGGDHRGRRRRDRADLGAPEARAAFAG